LFILHFAENKLVVVVMVVLVVLVFIVCENVCENMKMSDQK